MDMNTVILLLIEHFTQLTSTLISNPLGVFVHGIAIVWYSTSSVLDQCVNNIQGPLASSVLILQNQV